MPTYSYRCTECDQAFDIQQAFTDDTLTVCPHCGGVLRKVFSPIGVSFTGSGFYRNDSRAKPAGATGSEPAKADSAKSESAKSESAKSDAATPAKKETTSPTSTPSTTSGTKKATSSSAATKAS